MKKNRKNLLLYGLVTALTLVGGMILGIGAASGLAEALPSHMAARSAVAAIPVLLGLLGSGAAWGWLMNRLAERDEPRRMALAGMLGFSLPAFIAMLTLFALEGLVESAFRLAGAQPPPIHRIFTLLFVPTAFILAGTGGWALGVALRDRPLARSVGLSAGLAAGVAFLVINLTMEILGWQVGGPGAAERVTMLTVSAAGCIGAALAGGTAVGYRLSQSAAVPESPPGDQQEVIGTSRLHIETTD
jgi:MFS family permease